MSEHTGRTAIVTRTEVILLILAIAALGVLLMFGARAHQPFASAEVQFTDASAHGLAIVPASCPSSPDYPGECGQQCTPSTTCVNATTQRNTSATCAVSDTICPAGWSCDSGACVQPPAIGFYSFPATGPNGNFQATGHLQVSPQLIAAGSTTHAYWSVSNVKSCTVTGTNGDSWTGASSGASGKVTGLVNSQTIYTLSCIGLDGSPTPSLNETVTVNIIPTFQEQ